MFIDICNTNEEADWAVQYHKAQGHTKVKKSPIAGGELAVSIVEDDPTTQFKLVGIHLEMGGQVWVVTADP